MIRALALLLLAGFGVAVSLCFAASPFDPPVNAEYRKLSAEVIWIETNDIRQICGSAALACALPGDPCTVWTYPDPAFDTLGHEVIHCFKGRFHPERKRNEPT